MFCWKSAFYQNNWMAVYFSQVSLPLILAICAGASQISPDGKCEWKISMDLSYKRSGMEIDMVEDIKRLKEEKDVVILAHYYVDGKVQEIRIM